MIDPAILEAAAKGLAMVFGKTAGETGIKLLGGAGSNLLDGAGNLTKAARELLFPISRKYVANYTERHGTLKVLGMGAPVSLDSVYTKVNFQADTIRGYQSLEDLEKVFREREKKEQEKQPGLEVANQKQYLMVLGNPGSGKTTFLRKVGLEALKGRRNGEYRHICIPVLLELRKFRSGKIDLIKAIASEFQNCGLPEYQECTEELLKKGRLLILLDGLDEVASDRLNQMTTQIRDLLDRYSDNRFIASCRIAAYRNFDNFRRFTDVAIADFDDRQIKTFITKWFESHSQPEWGQQCWEKLNNRDHEATKELTRTPLLLTLICILFKKRGEFPNKRATVYNEALWTLLSEWDASKEIVRSAPYQGMDTKCKEIMLAEIAHDNFVVDNLFFQQSEITQQIESILGKMLPDEKFIDGRAVLRAIEEQHGVLISRSDDIYSFSHLTLQEFLTAKHIVDNNIDLEELINQHLYDSRWREVFLILVGLRRADNLLLAMEKKVINSLVNTPKLKNLLVWIEQITDTSPGYFKPVSKRAISLANALALDYVSVLAYTNEDAYAFDNTINSAYSLDNSLDSTLAYAFNNAYALGNALDTAFDFANANVFVFSNTYLLDNDRVVQEFIDYTRWSEKFQIYRNVNYSQLITTLEKLKQQIPNKKESKQVHQAFSQQIIQAWLKAFHLSPKIFDLSSFEIRALDNYLNTNRLMLECKNAAVWSLQETWSEIESRMLLPISKKKGWLQSIFN